MGRRLPHLLRYFRLSPTATQSELRQAYLLRAKECHPDVAQSAAAHAEFHHLQTRFEEAKQLLQDAETLNAFKDGLPSHSMHTDRDHWEHVAHKEGFTGSRASGANRGRGPGDGYLAVPCIGFPAQQVYALTAAAALGAAALMARPNQKRSTSPTRLEQNDDVTEAPQVAKREWPALVSGPWSVACAKAEATSKTVWSPSKDFKYLDSDSFFATRSKGHLRTGIGQRRRLGEVQGGQIKDIGYAADFEPIERDGVEMLPVHLAAEEGKIWWLEKCGATQMCRAMLVHPDTAKDTPLHHAARVGQMSSVKALLRLGADVEAKNQDELSPAELANKEGHKELAKLLEEATSAAADLDMAETENEKFLGGSAALCAVQSHPDGLGIQTEPPEEVVFVGLKESEPLRRAVNMSVGYSVAPPLPIPRNLQEGGLATAERMVNVVRGAIQDTEFMLEETDTISGDPLPMDAAGAQLEHRGLLFYEPPGVVTEDAPGHWFAVRRRPNGPGGAEQYWRLDPIRGPFVLQKGELEELLKRYKSWVSIRGPEELRKQRIDKLYSALEEATALVKKRDTKNLVPPPPPSN